MKTKETNTQMDKEDVGKTKVLLPHDFFFVVDTYSYNLYKKYIDKKGKHGVTQCLGYYTKMENLIKKVVQLVIKDKKDILELKEFLNIWKELSEELDIYVSKIKIL